MATILINDSVIVWVFWGVIFQAKTLRNILWFLFLDKELAAFLCFRLV